MIRLACFFGLVALATVVLLAIRTVGATAILFSFVGFPALVLALALYAAHRWRTEAYRSDGTPRPSLLR